MDNKVGIILVNYNGAKFNSDCIESIKKSSHSNFEIIVVDNASNDESVMILERDYSKDIVLIKSAENLGFSGANNLGIDYALSNGCDYVMLLNNDTIIDKDMINIMIRESNAEIVITPKIYYFDNNKVIWSAGGKMLWKKGIPYQLGLGEEDKSQYNLSYNVEIATGCCLLIPKKVIRKIGKLNDDYFLYYEDTDLSVRMLKEGFKIKYIPNAFMYHRVSASTGGEESYIYIYYNTRNRLLFNKIYNSKNKVYYTTYFYITRLFKIIKWILEGRRDLCSATIKGIVDFYSEQLGKLKQN